MLNAFQLFSVPRVSFTGFLACLIVKNIDFRISNCIIVQVVKALSPIPRTAMSDCSVIT